MRNLLTLTFALVASVAIAQVDPQPRLGVVLDLERPSDTDVLLLRNGDQLTGTILNESFNIRTSYAELSFNNRVVAGIDLEGGANNIESIITVNDNRFSGFINDPVFVFRLQSGPVIEIRREKVLKAVFRLREQEREGIPQRQFVTMKNGDYFSGLLLNTDLVAATTYADVPLDLTSIESITFIGEANPLTRILFHNGDALQGILNQEDIRFVLDVGGEVEIYQDRIESVFLREGFVPGHEPEADSEPSNPGATARPASSTSGQHIGAVKVDVHGQDYRDQRMQEALLFAVDWTVVFDQLQFAFSAAPYSVENLTFDPERSRQLMAEAGWANGYSVAVYTVTELTRQAQVVAEYLADVGIAAELVTTGLDPAHLTLVNESSGVGVIDEVVGDRLVVLLPWR